MADAKTRTRVAPHPCRPIDATGAGDCFGGAFVARLVAGDSPVDAARYAGVAAALSTEGYGAVAPSRGQRPYGRRWGAELRRKAQGKRPGLVMAGFSPAIHDFG